MPKIYCKVQKRNRKLHWVHVHLVRNELISIHFHFSLQKSDQHSIHERELNGKSSVPSPTMLSYTWLYIHFYFSHFMYLVNLAFDNQNFRQWTVRYKAIRHIFLSLREDPPTLQVNRAKSVATRVYNSHCDASRKLSLTNSKCLIHYYLILVKFS